VGVAVEGLLHQLVEPVGQQVVQVVQGEPQVLG